jgi:hypothetical protein
MEKKFRKKLAENLLGSGSGRFQKSDPDPVKNCPDPQHEPVTNSCLNKICESGLT